MANEIEFTEDIGSNYNPKRNVALSLTKEYERVIVNSLVTSFGLDLLLANDQHGGDVDTVHNVRQMGSDPEMSFKNERHRQAYENRGAYDSKQYHSHSNFRKAKQEGKKRFERDGFIKNEYKDGNLGFGAGYSPEHRAELDHIISAKEIHDDPGRILAGLDGVELANSEDNFAWTDKHTNASKREMSVETYIAKHPELSAQEIEKMRGPSGKSRKSYDSKVNDYYSNLEFAYDTGLASVKQGGRMALRQFLGLVFTEIWCAVRCELVKNDDDASGFFDRVIKGLKQGIARVKERFGDLIKTAFGGALSGVFASLTTTLINIFATTAKRLVKIIRECWSYLVDAIKVLIFNPDNLPFGERLRAGAKIIAAGASVVCGGLMAEFVGKLGVDSLPFGLGDIVTTFVGTFTTGIMSITLMRALDYDFKVKQVVEYLKRKIAADEIALTEAIQLLNDTLEDYGKQVQANTKVLKQHNETIEKHNELIYDAFGAVKSVASFAWNSIERLHAEKAMTAVLHKVMQVRGIPNPFGNKGYKAFMKDKNARMRFK